MSERIQPTKKELKELRREERRRQREAEIVRRAIRRRTLLTGGSVAGVAFLLAGIMVCRRGQEYEGDLDKAEREFIQGRDRTERIIAEVEEGMKLLQVDAEPFIATVGDPKIAAILRLPFQAAEANTSNPSKNFYSVALKRVSQQRQLGDRKYKSIPYRPQNDAFYSYVVQGVKAGFDPLQRVISFPPDLKRGNTIDRLIMYHEIGHAAQDTKARRGDYGVPYSKFEELYKKEQNVVLDFELEMLAAEALLCDLLIGGRLREDSMKARFVVADYLRLFNARPDEGKKVERIGTVGAAFFRSGSTLTVFSPEFIKNTKDAIMKNGDEPYSITPSGFVRVT